MWNGKSPLRRTIALVQLSGEGGHFGDEVAGLVVSNLTGEEAYECASDLGMITKSHRVLLIHLDQRLQSAHGIPTGCLCFVGWVDVHPHLAVDEEIITDTDQLVGD